MVRKFDFLVIGSGIAGMSFALKVAHKGKVALICKSGLEEANTYFAQGGVASVTNLLVDNFDKHIEDTMNAGDWISDRAAVEKVVREAPAQIEELIKWGVDFDKNEKGEFDLHREGGHSEFRILHHKDNTGAEIQDSLIKAVQRHPNITVIENQFAIEILTQHHLGVTVTRNPYPKYVYWEDFEMDGLHRKGFYNLFVKERPNDDINARTRYEMSITDNHITLNVDNVVYETVQKDPRWGIEMKFRKNYKPAAKGKVIIYLCDELVDLKKEITVTVNGKQAFQGKLKPDLKNMVNSCAAFFDPQRIYPAAIEVTL